MKIVTEEEALDMFRKRLTYTTKQRHLAKEFGVSNSMISAVMTGKKNMTPAMLASVGCKYVLVCEADQ